MKRINENENGFTLIEPLLILLILGILGFAGWYVYSHHHAAKTSSTPTATSTTLAVNPYTGWKTYRSTYENVSFKYPSNWIVSVTPEPVSDGTVANGNVLTITSPTGTVVNFQAPAQGQGGACSSAAVDQVTPLGVTAANALYMVFTSSSTDTYIGVDDLVQNNSQDKQTVPTVGETTCGAVPAYVSKSHTQTVEENGISSLAPTDYISFYTSRSGSMSNAAYLALSDTHTAELMFKSLTY
jgi:Tfp pilus assembly protein PilV